MKVFIFIWDSNHVDLQRKMTLLCISLAWFIRCILKKRHNLFIEWLAFILFCIGPFFWFIFSETLIALILKEKRPLTLHYFFSLNTLLLCHQQRRKLLIEWLHDLYFFCCFFYFGWKDCCNFALSIVCKTGSDWVVVHPID